MFEIFGQMEDISNGSKSLFQIFFETIWYRFPKSHIKRQIGSLSLEAAETSMIMTVSLFASARLIRQVILQLYILSLLNSRISILTVVAEDLFEGVSDLKFRTVWRCSDSPARHSLSYAPAAFKMEKFKFSNCLSAPDFFNFYLFTVW